jgi:hypothetical protein
MTTATSDGPDAKVIGICNQAIAPFERVRGWNDGAVSYPGDEHASIETQQPAWELTRKAMASEVTTLAGVRAQVALLLIHYERQGYPPEHPDIELPPLRSLLRLIPPPVPRWQRTMRPIPPELMPGGSECDDTIGTPDEPGPEHAVL